MGRPRRVFLPGISLHVIQRGNNRMNVFQQSDDYQAFLGLLRRAAESHDVAIHAYVLMTNHVHLIVTPGHALSLPTAMKELGGHYVRFYNKKYERTGTLWNGRYRGLPIRDESYWLTCLKCIEQNPVRAGIVNSSSEYRWSSYQAHAFGKWPTWLTPHAVYTALGPTSERRQAAYCSLITASLREDQLVVARQPSLG